MTHQDEHKTVSFKPVKSYLTPADFWCALMLFFCLIILVGVLAAGLTPKTWFSFVIGLGFLPVPALLLLRSNLSVPRMVEISADRLRIYYPHKFVFIDRSDLTNVTMAYHYGDSMFWKSKRSFAIHFAKNSKATIRLDIFDNSDKLAQSLRNWCLPALIAQTSRPPKPVWTDAKVSDQISSIVFAVIFGLLVVPGAAPQWTLLGQFFVCFSIAASIIVIKINARKVSFLTDRLMIHGLIKCRPIRFEDIEDLHIRSVGSQQHLVASTSYGALPAFTSAHRGFLHVRNFLLANCHNAKVTGHYDPAELDFSPFSPNELHNLPTSEILSTQETDSTTHHFTLGDTP